MLWDASNRGSGRKVLEKGQRGFLGRKHKPCWMQSPCLLHQGLHSNINPIPSARCRSRVSAGCPHETPTTRGCYMILKYIPYIMVPNNRDKFQDQCRNDMPPWLKVMYHLTSATCCKDRRLKTKIWKIRLKEGKTGRYRNDMPPQICVPFHTSHVL